MDIYVGDRIKINLELLELSIYGVLTLNQNTESLILWRVSVHMLGKENEGGGGLLCDFNTKMSYRSLNETKRFSSEYRKQNKPPIIPPKAEGHHKFKIKSMYLYSTLICSLFSI